MDESTQQRFRPLIEKRLAAIEQQLPLAPESTNAPAGVAAPNASDLHAEQTRLQHAQRRLEGGFFGRCIRCGRDLPVKRLERELDAVTCDPCPPRLMQPPRSAKRRTSLA